ncbi:MAG TPA: FlgD immunoglobulin-like domain containing protein [Armatimonadota bacterium]
MQTRIFLCVLAVMCLGALAGWSAPITYTVKTPGAVSVGVYDAKGRLLRTLQSGKKITEAGVNTIEWDGKDDLGTLQLPGLYTVKGHSANLGWQYQLLMGNAGKPPYLTEDSKGAWGGVWGHVKDIVADDTGKNLYILWAMEEGTPALLKIDPQGGVSTFKLWGAHTNWGWGTCQTLAADAKYVYVANYQTIDDPANKGKKLLRSLIWRVNAETGEYATTYEENAGIVAEVSRISTDTIPERPRNWEMYDTPSKRKSPGFATNLFGLAVGPQYLYCSLRLENKILLLDKNTGKKLDEVSIPEPGGLAMAPDGNLYALSGTQLMKLSAQGKRLATVIATGLEAPYDLCVDTKGLLYISDQATSMQIKVFSPAGKLVQTIGKAGGRPYAGEWAKMKENLLFPTGPAVTADGTLYVGEECAPKRVAIFKKGRWADEWVGPLASGCAKMDIADEENPEYIYQSYWPEDMLRYKVDYAKKTFVVDAVWGYFGVGAGGVEYRKKNGIKQYQEFSSGRSGGQVRHYQGNTFLCTFGSFYRVEGYNLIPSGIVNTGVWSQDTTFDLVSKEWKSRPPGDRRFIAWRDVNGDWMPQENEVDWTAPASAATKMPLAAFWLRPYVAPNMDIYLYGWKLPCQGLDAQSNPIYSWVKAERLPLRPMGVLADPKIAWNLNSKMLNLPYDAPRDLPGAIYPGGREMNLWTDPQDGSLYLASDMEGKGKGLGWAASGIYARIGRLSPQGEWLWMTGEKALGFAKPGQCYKLGGFAGVAKGCLFINDWMGQYRVYDKDSGLYVGSLFADLCRGPKLDENVISVEFNEGHVYTHPKTGQIYALAGDSTGLKLFTVTGVEQIERFTGTVTLPAQ